MQNLVRAGLCGLALLITAAAQDGRYEGTLATPNGDMHVTIDLAKNASGGWVGSSELAPGPTGILLETIVVDGDNVSWVMGIPGAPAFKGTVNKETKAIAGKLAARGAELPLELKRTGEAKVDLPAASTPVSKELAGKWVGSLATPNGQTLRLELDLTNGDGKATAVLTSVDQNNAKMTANSFVQKGSDVVMDVRQVGAKIKGKASADNSTIDATIDQGGASMPLKLTRPAPAATVK